MDVIVNGTETEGPEAQQEEPTWGHPGTLAVVALVLAFLSLMGAAAFQGFRYTLPLAASSAEVLNGDTSSKSYAVAGAFLTAAFALIPLLAARTGLSRFVPDDGQWVAHLLRAAYLLAGLSLVLHLVRAVLTTVSDGGPGGMFSLLYG